MGNVEDSKLKSEVKFLILSDFSWTKNNKANFIKKTKEIIEKNKPDCILFAGDLINDGWGDNESFASEFFKILLYLEKKKIYSFLIKGNHDVDFIKEYCFMIKKINKFKYIKDISNKYASYRGFNFYGLPFDAIQSRGEAEKITEQIKSVDFILTHNSSDQYGWLFHFPTKLIIRGHFGTNFNNILDKIIVSNDASPDSYVTIYFKTKKNYDISFPSINTDINIRDGKIIKSVAPNSSNKWEKLQKLHWELLVKSKKEYIKTKNKGIIYDLYMNGVPKKSIETYFRTNAIARDVYNQYKKDGQPKTKEYKKLIQ